MRSLQHLSQSIFLLGGTCIVDWLLYSVSDRHVVVCVTVSINPGRCFLWLRPILLILWMVQLFDIVACYVVDCQSFLELIQTETEIVSCN